MSNTNIYGLALKTNKKKSGSKDILEMKQRSEYFLNGNILLASRRHRTSI